MGGGLKVRMPLFRFRNKGSLLRMLPGQGSVSQWLGLRTWATLELPVLGMVPYPLCAAAFLPVQGGKETVPASKGVKEMK